MKKLILSHQDILVGGRSTSPHPLVVKISFTLGLCVYYKTTILNSKPRWNISALSGLIPSMRATGARKHTSQGGMCLLVHVWWNPFTRLSVTASVSMLAYLMLAIKLFWHIMESTTKRGRMANKSIYLVVHQALCNV